MPHILSSIQPKHTFVLSDHVLSTTNNTLTCQLKPDATELLTKNALNPGLSKRILIGGYCETKIRGFESIVEPHSKKQHQSTQKSTEEEKRPTSQNINCFNEGRVLNVVKLYLQKH